MWQPGAGPLVLGRECETFAYGPQQLLTRFADKFEGAWAKRWGLVKIKSKVNKLLACEPAPPRSFFVRWKHRGNAD